MSSLSRIGVSTRAFLLDYCDRHKHPLNAVLHLFGVPMVFLGLAKLSTGKALFGAGLFVLGYFLQYLGHKAQGNEVGEVTLLRKIWARVNGGNQSAGAGKGE